MRKKKIILRRRVTLQRLRLPNGQSFIARYERVRRQNLHRNVTVRRTRQIGVQNKRKPKTQTGWGIFGTIARLGTKALTFTGLLRKGLGVGARYWKKTSQWRNSGRPRIISSGTSEIRNKNMKKALESEVANYIVKEAQKKAAENVENLFYSWKVSEGISNF